MSETKWTAGPWGLSGGMEVWVVAGPLHVATIPRTEDGDWSKANAHLIAAAPTLDEAAGRAIEIIKANLYHQREKVEDAVSILEAARAKARGEQS